MVRRRAMVRLWHNYVGKTRLNLFPANGGVSSYYSPQVILHWTVNEYSKHCAIQFGAYVQAADDDAIKNTQFIRNLKSRIFADMQSTPLQEFNKEYRLPKEGKPDM